MKRFAILFALLPAFALAGCGGGPRLDATSKETVLVSIKALGKGKSDEQQQELGKAIWTLAFPEMMRQSFGAPGPPPADGEAFVRALKPYDGMTAEELIVRARERRTELQAKLQPTAHGL